MSWNDFRKKVKAKRTGKNENGASGAGANILQSGEMVVQRLSAEVSGKAQKYTRVGAREFVPYTFPDISLENIKESCIKHFQSSLGGSKFECDILAGEQGPSCKTLSHIPDMKVIHVRFVKASHGCETDNDKYSLISLPPPPKVFRTYRRGSQVQLMPKPAAVPGSSANKGPGKVIFSNASTQIPKSLTLSEMLKLGRVVEGQDGTALNLFKFDLPKLSWSSIPIKVEVIIEDEPFGTGGFRNAFKAKCLTPGFSKQWVIKRYLESAKKSIHEQMGITLEEHTKRAVQMHLLSNTFCEQLANKVKEEGKSEHFGPFLQYDKIYFAKQSSNDECITMEEFIPGEFTKYMNNNGKMCVSSSNVIGQKSECLAHYSLEKSNKRLMVTDIQGSSYTLCDPEVASANVLDADDKVLFCAGNLTHIAINQFCKDHICNRFCKMAGLTEFGIAASDS